MNLLSKLEIRLDRKYEIKQCRDYISIYENGKEVYCKDSDFSYVCTYDDRGNILTYENSKDYKAIRTYDSNGMLLTKTENGELVIDNRKVTIELTQEQLNKIKHLL